VLWSFVQVLSPSPVVGVLQERAALTEQLGPDADAASDDVVAAPAPFAAPDEAASGAPEATAARWDEVAARLIQGGVALDLNALARGNSPAEVDNVRWSLVRRTPQAAAVYKPETGVDWQALRGVATWGTILVPAGFSWSFNETFKQGPGYKQASGILAGGHCALATLFREAADVAGLPTHYRTHATPIPGYSLQESVNILWGRDDLVVDNTSGRDLYLLWSVGAEQVKLVVVPVTEELPLPALPDWRQGTVAMVYGRPGPGGWGSLGQTSYVDHALFQARTFAGRVDQWNGDRLVAVAVNPNVVMAGKAAERDLYLYQLIAEARRQGYFVMLDVQPGAGEPLAYFDALMDKFLLENVWFDWDVEHTAGGRVDAAQINQVAAAYFARREAAGFQTPGILGFYVFKENQVSNPGEVQRGYAGGVVTPIFDGYGGRSANPGGDKIAKTARIVGLFGEGDYGVMEFETRWGTRYDKISARSYFDAFPQARIFASQ
jgi:hypothetical protein